MANFHINTATGKVGVCKVDSSKLSSRGCRFGTQDQHFESAEAAREAYESSMSGELVGSSTSKPRAANAHILEADRLMAELEPSMVERDQRQLNGTLRHQLAEVGLTKDELKYRSSRMIANGMAGIGERTGNSEGSDRVVGLTYAPRGGEVETIQEIGEGLASGNYGPNDVQVFESNGATFLAIKTASAKSWSRSLKSNSAVKASTEAAHADYRRASRASSQAMGSLAGGEALVLTTKDPIEAKLLHQLKDAHTAGSLRVGNPGSPSDKMFYDDRDISRSHKTREIYQAEEEKAANEQIEDLRARMAKKDPDSYIRYTKDDYAVGKGVTDDISKVQYSVRYRIPNSSQSDTGLFTKDEAERVLDGDALHILNGRRERMSRLSSY